MLVTFRNFSRIILFAAAIIAVGSTAKLVHAAIRFTGVNLSGAEFGATSLPGTNNTNYTYPYNSEVDYFTNKGMNTIRLPFRWERLQTAANGALNGAELTRMTSFVNYATSKGAYTILDPHNFARYYPSPVSETQTSTAGVLGGDVANSVFGDFWGKVATQFKGNNHVIFNLMNEPSYIDSDQWVGAAQAAINAIRAAGAQNLILVPGNRYTGAWTWNNAFDVAQPHNINQGRANADAMLNITDPGDNWAIDVHQYFDSNGSGNSTQIANNDPNIGKTRITAFTDWMHDQNMNHGKHLKGFLGEFAVGNSTIGSDPTNQIGDEVVNNMLDYMQTNSDVWMGWTWWAAGPWWPGGPDPGHAGQTPMIFLLDPANLGQVNQTDKPAMGLLQPRLAHPVTGDYDGNGLVNADDYTVWQNSFGQTGAGLAADGNLNGIVDAGDYTIWRDHANLGGGGAIAGGNVPEPSALALLAIGGIGLGLFRRGRR